MNVVVLQAAQCTLSTDSRYDLDSVKMGLMHLLKKYNFLVVRKFSVCPRTR